MIPEGNPKVVRVSRPRANLCLKYSSADIDFLRQNAWVDGNALRSRRVVGGACRSDSDGKTSRPENKKKQHFRNCKKWASCRPTHPLNKKAKHRIFGVRSVTKTGKWASRSPAHIQNAKKNNSFFGAKFVPKSTKWASCSPCPHPKRKKKRKNLIFGAKFVPKSTKWASCSPAHIQNARKTKTPIFGAKFVPTRENVPRAALPASKTQTKNEKMIFGAKFVPKK